MTELLRPEFWTLAVKFRGIVRDGEKRYGADRRSDLRGIENNLNGLAARLAGADDSYSAFWRTAGYPEVALMTLSRAGRRPGFPRSILRK